MVGNQEIIPKTENQNVLFISMLFENVKVNNQERAKRLEGDWLWEVEISSGEEWEMFLHIYYFDANKI